jgi:hypothetical protein
MTEQRTYTLATRISYLRSFAGRNAQGVTQFEAALMRNLFEMSEADRAKLGAPTQSHLIACLDRLKKATNEISSVLNELSRDFRNSGGEDIPL